MTIEELETGLRRLNQRPAGDFTFWDENIVAFRQTVLVAIRETVEMLASGSIPADSWIELEKQGLLLRRYLKLADDYLRSRNRTRMPIGMVSN